MEVNNLLDIHSREELYRWYLENHDNVSDFWLRVNRAAPDLDPCRFVFEDWVLDSLKADEKAWANYTSFPETYRRIRVDYIQHYRQTGREEQARKALQRFVQDCHAGKMQSGWDDYGRLK